MPPGFLLWVPLSVFVVIFAFIAGGWAASAGQGLYALVHGEAPPSGAEEPRLWAIGLLVLVFVIAASARRVSRALELANWSMIGSILIGLILIDLFVVPWELWWDGIRGFFTPAAPPDGITATQLGGLAGFTALASGLNWYVMGHYRDKGYGMGYRTGFISGLRGERKEVAPVGFIFPDDAANTRRWRRWYRLLLTDMWGVFFVGAMFGMLLPIWADDGLPDHDYGFDRAGCQQLSGPASVSYRFPRRDQSRGAAGQYCRNGRHRSHTKRRTEDRRRNAVVDEAAERRLIARCVPAIKIVSKIAQSRE